MGKRIRQITFILVACFAVMMPVQAAPRVGLFVPHNGNFWGQFSEYAQAAAQAVGLELQVYAAGRSPERMLEQVRRVTDQGVDGILFTDYQGIGEDILRIAEASRTPAFLVNAGLRNPDKVPRTHYRYWIGGVSPDDQQAGVRLATRLIEMASKRGENAFRILAFTGKHELPMVRRLAGLKAVVNARPDVTLVEALPINDGESAATEIFDRVMSEDPGLNIVWSFYDELALSAATHYRETGGSKQVVFGGINWSERSMQGLEQGLIDVDIGGNIFDGAQGVVMIFDYLNGHDFSDEGLLFDSNMVAATVDTVGRFKRILADPLSIDYRALSKTHNPDLKQYRFDLNEIATHLKPTVGLTPGERNWINNHSRVKVGVVPDWAPFDMIDDKGEYMGVTRDVIDLVAQKTGLHFVFETDAWDKLLDGIGKGEYDLLGSVYYTANRDKFLNYTQPYFEVLDYFFVRDDLDVRNLSDLRGLRVAIPRRYALIDKLEQFFPQLKIVLVDSMPEALEAVLERRADILFDAYAVLDFLLKKKSISSIVPFKSTRHLGSSFLHLVTREDQPVLSSILRKGLAAITNEEKRKIYGRWLGAGVEPVTVELSAPEQAWLDQHRLLRFTGDPNWLPYEAVNDKGEYIGIVSDHLRLIESILGVRFEYVPTETWSESVAKAREGGVDVLSETDNSELASVLRFTKPYLSSPVVIVMNESRGYVGNINQIASQRIAVIKDYGYVPEIRARYPDLDYYTVDTIQDGLTAVSTGAVDALLSTLAQASYHIGELGINNVRIVGRTEFDTRLALGVQKWLEPLVPLLNRALDAITKGQKQQILDRWGREKFAARTNYERITLVMAIAGVVVALTLLWTYSIRRQKERLRISEERFQLAMDAASVGLWDWNGRTGEVFYSPLWMTMLGYAKDELPGTFETFCKLLHPEDRERVLADNERLLNDPDMKYEQELRLRTKEGGYRWILSRGHVFARDAEGKALRALGTHTDITRRKQAELDVHRLNQNLLAANRRFALATQAIALGVWERLTDGTNRLVFDDCLLEIYGFGNRDYVTLREWLQRVHRSDRKAITAGLRKVMRDGGDFQVDFRICRPDGSMRYIYGAVTVIPAGDDELDQLIGVNWDITERKAAEVQFKKVLNALPVAVAIADGEGKILLANPRAQEEFGGDIPVVGSQTDAFYANAGQREEIVGILEQQGQVSMHEVQYRNGRGEIIEGILSALPISFNDQPALLGVVVNITERRNMERELARAKEQAEEASHFKGQFLANMSHEIRTPMNAIVGLGHLLSRTSLTPRQQDYLGKIQISARSLLTIIDDILDFSKIEAGQLRVEQIDFDLNEVLDNITTLAGTRLAEKPVEFIYDIDPDVPSRLHGDPHRLTQILTNLVGNATKFTREGSIIVGIRKRLENDSLELQFRVEDTGIGIAPDKIDKLFSPFIQADGSTTREYGGTGLGLSICKQLADLMGGSLSAYSTLGKGSCFELKLPFGIAEQQIPRYRLPTEGLRVLLVEDNAITRQVLADLLLSLSYRVDVVASGAEALDRLRTTARPYDLLLLDWRMPDPDGFETARIVRQSDLQVQPRIIMMTAYGREAMEQALDLEGIDGFLVKPLTPSHLLDAVAQAFGPNPEPAYREQNLLGDDELPELQGEVLLVEDNPINQQVAKELLEQMGLSVTVCGNAKQALDQVQRRRPDVVLMDIQMPDLDGYEATARIRRLSGMQSLPILAMTANAMVGDAERSLEAGMNGHIPKPVDPALLHATLSTWLGQHTPTKGSVARIDEDQGTAKVNYRRDPPVRTYPPDSAIDFAIGLLQVGGNQQLYERLLSEFTERYGDFVQRLEGHCLAGERREVGHLLHTLKGVAGNIGALQVQDAAAALEPYAQQTDLSAVEFRLPKLKLALDQTLGALREYMSNAPNDGSPSQSPQGLGDEPVEDLLSRLALLLDDGDVEALNLVARINAMSFGDQGNLLADRLVVQINNYEFDAARQTLNLLSREIAARAG
ncbi:MAG: transporter substrate-binding domain-containing protein [Gammaproteobacteria bacterium]|nr:transporter substrate-binding domain-containing protein [Gammaproteobacteria bacterium]